MATNVDYSTQEVQNKVLDTTKNAFKVSLVGAQSGVTETVKISDGTDTVLVTTGGSMNVLDDNSLAIKTAVEIMDDWDETDRAKVNPVVGQTGLAAGTGVDAANALRVSLATNIPLPSGTNAIGKLVANSGVDIGDVDVTSVIPGTGATNLGKAIDATGGASDTGIAPLAVRDDALSVLTPIEGDYVPLRTDANGALWTHDDALDAALAGSELQIDVVTSALPAGAATSALQTTGNTSLAAIDADTSAIQTAVELIDNSIAVVGAAVPASGTAMAGTDGTLARLIKTDVAGELQVDVLSFPDNEPFNLNQVGGTGVTLGQKTSAASIPVVLPSDQTVEINITGDASDLDSGVGTDNHEVFAIGLPASGGHVIGGTSANPIRVDPVGTTAQPVTDNAGSLTVDNAALSVVGGGLEATALRVTVATDSTGILSVDDNAGSLTIDNVALSVTGGGVELGALRVTVANDSTGVLSVDDNGASLTVDVGTALPTGANNIGDVDVLTVPAPLNVTGGGVELGALRVTLASDSTGLVSVDDNGGSLTVDGTVTANAGTGPWPVTDNAGSLTVDAPAGTPVAVRQSDGTSAQTFFEGDMDSGVGTQNRIGIGLIVPASGGAAIVPGDTANGLDVDVTRVSGNVTVVQATAASLNATEVNSGAIKTAVELLDDTVYTDGIGTPSKAIGVAGTDGTNPQILKTDISGELQVDILTLPSVTIGTFPDNEPFNVAQYGGVAVGAGNAVHVQPGTAAVFQVGDNATTLSVDDGAGSLTIDGTVTANAGTGTFVVDQANAAEADYDTGAGTVNQVMVGMALPGAGGPVAGGTATAPLRVDPTGTTTQPISDAGGSLTVDNVALSVVGGGLEATALRVTLASDSTGLVSVDDNGGSLTVDIGVALPAGANNIGDVDILSIAAGDNNIGNVDIVTMPSTADLDTGVGTDTRLTVGIVAAASGGAVSIGGDVTNGLDVDVTRVSGNVTVVQATAASLNTTEASAAAIKTAVELIDDTVATVAAAVPTKGIALAGSDGTNARLVKTDTGGELQVDILSIAAGDTNIGNVDLVTLPSGNLGSQLMAASLSIVPASNITDALYIGDIKFGEGLPANSGIDIGDVTINNAAGASAVNIQDGGNSITVDSADLTAIKTAIEKLSGSVPVVTNATGALAIALSYAPVAAFWLESVTLHLSAAPVTSQNFTITLNAFDGVAYDTVLLKQDLSADAVTDLLWLPSAPILCESGDAIDLAYTNTDIRTYGVRIVARLA